MENFTTGHPGSEGLNRAAMFRVLGREKYECFFDRWLYHFFTEEDAKYYSSLGLKFIHVPFNYRHLEDGMNLRALNEDGFKHLGRVGNLVSQAYSEP